VLGSSTALVGAISWRWIANSVSSEVDLRQSVASVGLFGAITWFVVIAWGLELFRRSHGLARLVTGEPQADRAPSPQSTGGGIVGT
jgi:hypothetical protein